MTLEFKTRMEAVETLIAAMETQTALVIQQDVEPTQAEWETAWVTAGNTLPIPTTQDLLWKDSFGRLLGHFKTIRDNFQMLTYCLAKETASAGTALPGGELLILDVLGWEDDDHIILQVERLSEDGLPGGGGTAEYVRMYMDGTIESLGFTINLGYDTANGYAWIYNAGLTRVEYYDTVGLGTQVVLTGVVTPPTSAYFVILPDGSGDAYFGCQAGVDVQPSLYFWDESALLATNVLGTFNPGTGVINADKPCAATTNYVYLAEDNTRADLNGNKLHQINRTGYTFVSEVDSFAGADVIRTVVTGVDYAGDTIDVISTHLLAVNRTFSDWYQTATWDGATQTEIFTVGLPYATLLQALKSIDWGHELDYHFSERLYRTASFVADGGDAEHFNVVSSVVPNPSGTKVLLHDVHYRGPVATHEPLTEIYIHTIGTQTTTNKICRVSAWSRRNYDIYTAKEGVFSSADVYTIDFSDIPPEYGMLELIEEIRGGSSTSNVYYDTIVPHGTGGLDAHASAVRMDNVTPVTHVNSQGFQTAVTTKLGTRHTFILRNRPTNLTDEPEIEALIRIHVPSGSHYYIEGAVFVDNRGSDTVEQLRVQHDAYNGTNVRWVLRAWRTTGRNRKEGAGYDPRMV